MRHGKQRIVRDTRSTDRIVAGQVCNATRVRNYVTYSPDCDTFWPFKIGLRPTSPGFIAGPIPKVDSVTVQWHSIVVTTCGTVCRAWGISDPWTRGHRPTSKVAGLCRVPTVELSGNLG